MEINRIIAVLDTCVIAPMPFRFENEAAALVEIDTPVGGFATGMAEGDGALEYVMVFTAGDAGLGSRNVQEIAELR